MQLRQLIFTFYLTVVSILIGTTVSVAQVIPATEITCIQTDVNNNITVNWQGVNNPNNNFVQYDIYELNGGLLGSETNIATTSFQVPQTATQVFDFYVAVVSNNGGNTSAYSDTVQNIFLELNNPSNGLAVLSWNEPSVPALPNFGSSYDVYREYPTGTWSLIANLPYNQTNYTDTIDICSAFISYRVELSTTSCSFTSNIEGDDFEDEIVPDIPVLSHVSYQELSDDYQITWNANSQTDTYGYVIYIQDGTGAFVEIDTVFGINNTSFNHAPNANGPFTYTVAAFDSCFTDATPVTYQTSAKAPPHKSVWLSGGGSACSQDYSLMWTAYQGFGNSLTYDVMYREIGQAWQYEITTNTLNYDFPRVPGVDYEFQIIARENGELANSNIIEVLWDGASGPSVSYLSHVTVVGDEIEILHKVSLDGGIEKVELHKYNAALAVFEKIDEKLVGNGEVVFTDAGVDVQDEIDYYQTIIVDSCGNTYPPSLVSQNVLLSSKIDPIQLKVELQWTDYLEFIGSNDSYALYRAINGVVDDTPIANLGVNNRFYTDDLSNVLDDDFTGQVCYYVKTLEGLNPLGVSDSSSSNLSCVVLEPLIYIPTAFSVNGENPIFYPVTSYHRLTEYEFTVFNRYGQELFHTTQKSEGWNGYLSNGNVAREGVYVYRLSVRDGNGIEVLRHGHFTLLNASE